MTIYKRALRILIFGVLALQTACTVEADVGGGDSGGSFPLPSSNFDKPSIQGPKVEGTWKSECLYDFDYKYKQVTMIFEDGSFDYEREIFTDANCTKSHEVKGWDGLFQFSEKINDTEYVIDYSYILNRINYLHFGQRLSLDRDILYISDFTWTGYPVVDRGMPLRKSQTGPQPSPQPSPAPTSTPTPSPGKCHNYNGTYVGSFTFSFSQVGCESITFRAGNNVEYFITDGQFRDVGGLNTKAFYSNKNLTLEFEDSQGTLTRNEFVFTTTPCGTKPTGKTYLAREVYAKGIKHDQLCAYWEKSNTNNLKEQIL